MTRVNNNLIATVKRELGLRDTVEMQRQYGVTIPLNRLVSPLRIIMDTDYSVDESWL